ncbi:ABC transporter ATP-binding protein [Nocardioides lijunqiniae]|uniref:ABC transporter ATP-binding protein n=1 Tax=Nocardioides lijunqiniae TaxID=2760832 RepID=UPI001D0CB336|nr:ABC transporter ATP-binding protein [Nocardioides lijunqiniae]
MNATPAVQLRDLGVTYGGATGREVLRGIDLSIAPNEIVCIVGHSGIGKSTLIRCIAGLQRPTTGEVLIAGTAITAPPATLALVSQDYGRTLMPWLRVGENVRLPLRGVGLARAVQDERVAEALSVVGLVEAARSYPWQLSGGMQQRVAIARALAYRPQVLLMDEPFASVDAQTRAELEDLLLALQRDLGITVVLVTHDVDESVYLSDRVVVVGGRPALVREIVEVPISGVRDQLTTKADPAFIACRTRVLSSIQASKDSGSAVGG